MIMAGFSYPGHSKMKRMESRKSHSWWWDSHISPKNSKWLAENLEGKHLFEYAVTSRIFILHSNGGILKFVSWYTIG
ncbi:hypothetical protein CUMW_221950 [Citrus unshiu]|uniref:NAB domain-containing protein n=1 Tax=Citrus unshiu TaxID=55188 RepID=A0A2H5QEC3_CITUN|nr:hypothetical protein CUMW_221950 [Citrus unshiu]